MQGLYMDQPRPQGFLSFRYFYILRIKNIKDM